MRYMRRLAFACAMAGSTFATAAHASDDKTINIVAFGDSLTAGYRLPRTKAFPAQLEQALQDKGYKVRIRNAGVSGDTTKGGLARIDWAITKDTDAVIVELGANDALRGVSPDETRKNLDQILKRITAGGSQVLLTGYPAPSGYGPEYERKFASLFAELAKKYDAVFYANFLKGVMLQPALNQSDGLHPTAAGIGVIVRNILPDVRKLLARVQTKAKS